MTKRAIIAALAILTVTCGSEDTQVRDDSDPREFRADVTFTPDERKEIVRFLKHLSADTNTYIGITFDRPHTAMDDQGEFNLNERKVIFKTDAIEGGFYNGTKNREIRVQQKPDPRVMGRIVAHEVGHDIGLWHTPDGHGSLMSQYIWDNTDTHYVWTDLDQAECVRAGVCE